MEVHTAWTRHSTCGHCPTNESVKATRFIGEHEPTIMDTKDGLGLKIILTSPGKAEHMRANQQVLAHCLLPTPHVTGYSDSWQVHLNSREGSLLVNQALIEPKYNSETVVS